MKKELRGLSDLLSALRIDQTVSFDQSQTLVGEMHRATGSSIWPALSGNDICAFANLVIARLAAASTRADNQTMKD